MNKISRCLIVVSILIALSSMGVPTTSAQPVNGAVLPQSVDYIVRFNKGTNIHNEVAFNRLRGISVKRSFAHVFPGAVMRLNPSQVATFQKNSRVHTIEVDTKVTVADTQNGATWGLDRIDQTNLPLSGSFTWNGSGTGVTAYVVDTGIRATHAEFGGRVSAGFSIIPDTNATNDCHGHGSHVAGTIGGTTYGVAKSVNLVPVRVLDCTGSGSLSGVIAGLDWIIAHHQSGVPAVANMSLGSGASSSLDAAVQSVINDGVSVVVAAGNSNLDACTTSPARAPSALTVAATTSTDARASYSNFGTCVDIFAPGSSITSAWSTSNTATSTISGTSMAAPHVSGAVAALLTISPTLSPSGVASAVTGGATVGVVSSVGAGSPNRLLFLNGSTTISPPTMDVPGAPTGVVASPSRRSATVAWTQGPTGGSALTSQTITVYRANNVIGSVRVSGTATSVTITGLRQRTTYSFAVKATNSTGTGAESVRSNVVTILR